MSGGTILSVTKSTKNQQKKTLRFWKILGGTSIAGAVTF